MSVSDTEVPSTEVMFDMLEATAPPATKKGKKVVKLSRPSAPAVVAVVAEPVVEAVVEAPPIEVDTEVPAEVPTTTEILPQLPDYHRMYYELQNKFIELEGKYNGLLEKSKQPKNENSPDMENGIHMRMVEGVKTKCKYIFPYQADGGKSIINDMKDNTPCIGVSTTQKNNSKGQCKIADYNLVWLNKKTVKDTNTGIVYPHKDGKFAVVVGETAFNVRLMIVA
jgi:hypothetical protein